MNANTDTVAKTRRGSLESLELRQRLTTAEAAARAATVRRLRILLPVLAVGLVGIFLINTRENPVDEAFLNDFANLDATPEELTMANPRVAGIDDRGQPYEITAESALQATGAAETVELIRPRAVSRRDQDQTIAYADKGRFQSSTKVLDLEDDVTLEHGIAGAKYVLKTSAATVSIAEETVTSDAGIEGEGEAGTLRADRMRAYNGEGRVVFEGNVSMRIFPSKARDAGFIEKTGEEPQ